jgi:TatD DNase family protein
MIIDTHCHLYLPEFNDDIGDMIQRAEAVDVQKFYLPAIDSASYDALLNLEDRFPGKCIAMMGLHPCSVKENYLDEIALVESWLSQRPFAAIGEAGLDLYWDNTYLKQQYHALELQIELALKLDLAIILHTRNATRETIGVINKYQHSSFKGIFHCFGGTVEEARQITDMGFYLGIGGVVTYKNSGLAEVIKDISLNHIVLETDAPYLSPTPYRGKRNESSYLKNIVEKIADIKQCSFEEVAEQTTKNAKKIFKY